MELSQVLKNLGIKAVLFDLDDTLIGTHAIFKRHKDSIINFLATLLSVEEEIMRADYEAAFRSARSSCYVDPLPLWSKIFDNLQGKYPQIDGETKSVCLHAAMNIYAQTPQPLPGAFETLVELRGAGIQVAIVSHAALDWTMFKINSAGLARTFDHLELSSVNESKTGDVWSRAVESLGVPATQCLAIGDNLQGDCKAALEAGIREVVLMRHSDGWAFVSDGNVPAEVTVISSLAEIPTKLLEKHRNEFNLR